MEPRLDIVVGAQRAVDEPRYKRDVTFQMPAVISHRLDQLVTLLEGEEDGGHGAGAKQRTTTRKELISALVLDAATDRKSLESVLLRYRNATAGAAVIPARARGSIRLPAQPPGIRLTSDQEREKRTKGKASRRARYRDFP